jgi:dynein heavy chain
MDAVGEVNINTKGVSFSEIVVPTKDSVRSGYLLEILIRSKKNVLFTGSTGTGKTTAVMQFLSGGGHRFYNVNPRLLPLTITFSAQTSQNQTQDYLDSKMEKRKKGTYGPPAGKEFIIYVDDLNMPQREKYFAQPPLELLRQCITQGGWYDRKTLDFMNIIDKTFIASMGPPGGGRNPITARLKRHFNIINLVDYDDASKSLIFASILKDFLAVGNFEQDIIGIQDVLVNATIRTYNRISAELLPTPQRVHYTFNLRDLAGVFQGLLMCDAKHVTSSESFARLWVHECRRVFQDRLINTDDAKWFDDALRKEISENFEGLTWDEVVPRQRIFFGAYVSHDGAYEEIPDEARLQSTIEEYLENYNEENAKEQMHLVMFLDAIDHVSRIARILRQPQGNALCLGVGGSGRQSLTRLATFICEYSCFQVEIKKGYSMADWREDIKSCLLRAGVQQHRITFLFSDTQIVHEQMVEDINNVLNSGDLPNLYSPDEMDSIMSSCRTECQKKKIAPTPVNIFAQYLLRVRKNIHLVVCMSPLGDAFCNRLRMFFVLVNCCTIDWFMPWPDDALRSVAERALADDTLKLAEHSENLVEMFKSIHQSVESYSEEYRALKKYNYVTPTSYLSVLSTYKKALKDKRVEINGKIARLANGLNKLKTTKADVSVMQESLVKLQPELKKTSAEVDEMMVKITADKAVAAETKIAVQAEEKEASEIAAKAKAIADSAQADLDEALPALDAALESLDKLKKNDLDEVKALKTPPIGVKLTMEACCIMFEVKPDKVKDPNNQMSNKKINDYWGPSKKHLLVDPKALLARLRGFDKGNIPDNVIQTIGPYIEMEEFQPKAIEKASKACTAICMWVHAMNKYHWISISVEPKRIALREAEAELAEGTKRLESARSQLKAVLDNIQSLETQFSNAVSKKEALEDEMERCKIRLDSAMKLIGGLGGEESRWEKTVISLNEDYGNLIGDAVVSAGQISYSGAFPSDFRDNMKKEWIESMVDMNVPHTPNCSIISVLGNAVKIQGWQLNGLPSDDVSTENGIIIDKSSRWPLMIDPQGQANRYVKNLGKEVMGDNFDVGKESDKNFMRTLENGVRFGKWVLLENVGEALDAAFEPVLLKQTFRQGMSLMIRLGDNVVPYNDSFRFFITTKLPNPHYPPEVCVKVTLINFAITPKGLEEQLLAATIEQELPDVAQKKSALVVQNAAMNKELTEIEDKILFLLSSAEGNILDNVEVINALDDAKQTSDVIGQKMKEAEVTEKQIDISRESYRPVAAQASVLFFCIVDLAIVDPMYQYSLLWFTQLFILGMKDSEPSADLQQRMQILKDYFSYLLYENVCRSLFEKHKLLFAFLLCIRLLRSKNQVDPGEWRFLISGNTVESDQTENPGEWIDTRTWTEIQSLSSLPIFNGLASGFDLNAWRKVFDSATPEKEPYPGEWEIKLNTLQKMCILRALRPDKVIESMQLFVTEKIGQRFIEPPPFDLPLSFRPSTVTTALVFVLSPGSDPMKDLFNFADTMKMRKKFNAISLGQGQGPRAEKMMQVAMQKGEWVFLQNCHLMTSWMPRLEQLCENIDEDKVHKDFRLWLSSMPDKKFPVSVLQNSIKMTNEPPRGLRANLQSTYYRLDDDKLNVCTKPHEYKKLLFALSFFHALVIERKKFGPLGWNGCLSYEFNDTDFDICQSQLCLYLDKYDEVPYGVLNMLTEAINYGGRVTDDKDMRTIEVIMKRFYCENVMDDSYKFSESGLYKSFGYDPDAPYDSYNEYIASLPINPSPEAFGMHDNANITCAQNETYETFDVLLSLQATGGSSGSGTSAEDQMLEIARDIEKRLPLIYDEEAIGMSFPVDYNESMNTVLTQEVKRFNKLLRVMKETLKQAQRALQGFVLMSGDLESLVNSLYNNKVPEIWESNGYISLKPLKAWADDLMQRLEFLQTWCDEGTPKAFWISGFFFPQAFVTGTKQNYARKMQWPIDTISFDFVVKDHFKADASDVKDKPLDGCYMYGLFLEAARWNNETHVLDDPNPKELYSPMPIIHLDPIQNRKFTMKNVYHCPVYKVLTRRGQLSTTGHSTNFVMWIELPSDKKTIFRKSLVSETNAQVNFADSEEWVNGGVAMFCALRM